MTSNWLAVDWGTSHLRIWWINAEGSVLAQRHSSDGMGNLRPDGFEAALVELANDLLPVSEKTMVLICGMAGARQGWAEAPYVATPCPPPSVAAAVKVDTTDPRLAAHIIPGIKQERPADVMRGEETQIAGFLDEYPNFDGILCLPGTHCKWVQISAGEIVSFRTFMTGELFGLLEQASVLRHSMGGGGWDSATFLAALDEAIAHPALVSANLFSIRAEGLLHGADTNAARARLSGLLIGQELAGAKPYWLGQDIRVIGTGGIADAYHEALTAQGASVIKISGEGMALSGLKAAYKSFLEAAE